MNGKKITIFGKYLALGYILQGFTVGFQCCILKNIQYLRWFWKKNHAQVTDEKFWTIALSKSDQF